MDKKKHLCVIITFDPSMQFGFGFKTPFSRESITVTNDCPNWQITWCFM